MQFLSGYLALIKISWSLGLYHSWGVCSKQGRRKEGFGKHPEGWQQGCHVPREMLPRHRVLIWDPPRLPKRERTYPLSVVWKSALPVKRWGPAGSAKDVKEEGFWPKSVLCAYPPSPPAKFKWQFLRRSFFSLVDVWLVFCILPSPRHKYFDFAACSNMLRWRAKHWALCPGSAFPSEKPGVGSCVKQMNKGQGTKAGLGEFGPASGGCFRTIACPVGDCAFSPLPRSLKVPLSDF